MNVIPDDCGHSGPEMVIPGVVSPHFAWNDFSLSNISLDAGRVILGTKPPTPNSALRISLGHVNPYDNDKVCVETDGGGTMTESPQVAAEIAEANRELADASPQQVLRWAAKRFHPRLLMATAFGAEGCCVIHMLADIEPGTMFINLETGYQFPETLELRERIKDRYGITVEYITPEQTVERYETEHGGPLYNLRPDQCCHDRKILPLRQALKRLDPAAWISAIRKDQTADRGQAGVIQWDAKFNLVKVNPLLNWTKKEVWAFILENDVPYNPMHDRGFPSIGCWPCTRSVNAGEDDRAGRWAGKVKKECGLHVIEQQDGEGI